MDENCLFCRIGAKKIPSKTVYEDEEVFAFEDVSPQAPTHILICPRKHLASLHDATATDQNRVPPPFAFAWRSQFPLAAGLACSRVSVDSVLSFGGFGDFTAIFGQLRVDRS